MESSRSSAPSPSWFSTRPVQQIFAYYAVLGLVVLVLWYIEPYMQCIFAMKRFSGAVATGGRLLLEDEGSFVNIPPAVMAFESIVAMLGAGLMMIPVAWVYILTRARRGFNQSTVQTLIFLPIVVAGLILLVKSSLALAFGLGGVVGAVAFRNRLEDPKDAIYIFLSIAVGLDRKSVV